MKKYLIIFALLISTISISAQGNLQFNQVLNYQANASQPCGGAGQSFSYTVPAGKVWKIEYCNVSRNSPSDAGWAIRIDGINVFSTEGTTVNVPIQNTPLWIKENLTLSLTFSNYATGFTCPVTRTGTFGLSIIEFNVVP